MNGGSKEKNKFLSKNMSQIFLGISQSIQDTVLFLMSSANLKRTWQLLKICLELTQPDTMKQKLN